MLASYGYGQDREGTDEKGTDKKLADAVRDFPCLWQVSTRSYNDLKNKINGGQ